MRTSIARRSAAALALRWHAGTGTLVALTAALTLAGSLPALALLGGSTTAPSLTLALGDVPALLADWNGRGIVWPQLQQHWEGLPLSRASPLQERFLQQP